MNKRLKRMLWPKLWVYFLVMAGFVAAAVVREEYILAAAEGVLTLGLLLYYVLCRNHRKKEIENFVKHTFSVQEETMDADAPFPLVLLRMGDGAVIWANKWFSQMTGYQEGSDILTKMV